jgi:uncharacterized OsmC-like protein
VIPVESGSATPRSPVSVAVRLRGHTVVQDKPAASGGRDEGPMASEFVLAGLLACQHSTFVKVAAKRRLDAHVERIEADLHFDAAGDMARFDVRFTLRAPASVADAAIETALRLTDGACTVSKALKVPIHATFQRA